MTSHKSSPSLTPTSITNSAKTTTIALPSPTLAPELAASGRLAFSIWGPSSGIGVLDIRANNFTNITPGLGGVFQDVAWSPDGHWIAYTWNANPLDGYHQFELYITSVNGAETRKIPGPIPLAGMSWSPDGKKLAYAGFKDIAIIDLETGNVTTIATGEWFEYYLTWSPDGKKFAYLRGKAHVEGLDLFMMDADGQNQRAITDVQVGFGKISWSPDGKQIAYRSLDGCGNICTVSLDSGVHKCLMDTTGGERDPAWSPNGQWIAFLVTTSKVDCHANGNEGVVIGWQVYLMNSDGSEVTSLTNTGDTYLDLAWSPVPFLQLAGKYKITQAGDYLNLRDDHSLGGEILRKLREGEVVTILEGPVDTDNYYWWRMRTSDGVEGWAVEVAGWYIPAVYPGPPGVAPAPIPEGTPTATPRR